MKKRTLRKNFFVLFIVFSLLPLLFSAQSFLKLNNSHRNRLSFYEALPCDVEHSAVIAAVERILPTNHIRNTRFDPLTNQYQPRSIDYCFKGNSWSFFSAGLLYIFMYPVIVKPFCSRRYIIKYVHDQDGHKIAAPFSF